MDGQFLYKVPCMSLINMFTFFFSSSVQLVEFSSDKVRDIHGEQVIPDITAVIQIYHTAERCSGLIRELFNFSLLLVG